MNRPARLLVTALSLALLAGACAKKNDNPIESAVDHTKDALDARPHEAIKDAAEDVKDAATDVGQAAKDAAADAKQAVKPN